MVPKDERMRLLKLVELNRQRDEALEMWHASPVPTFEILDIIRNLSAKIRDLKRATP